MSKANNTNTTDNTNTTAAELTTLPNFASAIARLSENTSGVSVVLDVKAQKALIEENAPDSWEEFKVYLASVNYCLTPTKRILCDVGSAVSADLIRLTSRRQKRRK